MAAYPSLAFPPRVTLRQIVDEIVGAGGHEDDGDERRAQDAVRSGHVLKRRTAQMICHILVCMKTSWVQMLGIDPPAKVT